MYNASLRLAARTYNYGASHADELKRATAGFVSAAPSQGAGASNPQQNSGGAQQQTEQKNH